MDACGSVPSTTTPASFVRFHEHLQGAGLAISAQRASLKLLRAVLRWGRRRYPRTLTVDLSGLFQVPGHKRQRLMRATDPVAVERIIEAVLNRPHSQPLLPLRDAALVAAMGFTVAARPSEWLRSVTWADVRERTVELQAIQNELGEEAVSEGADSRPAHLLRAASPHRRGDPPAP